MKLHPFQELSDAPAEAYREILLPFGKFVAAFLVVYFVGRVFVAPTIGRVVRQRNPDNPTIQDAIKRYLQLLIVLVAIAFGLSASGYGQVLTNSALIIAAATLAVGVAGQEVIGAVVSGLFLVANSNFNVGDWIAWGDREGVVEAISFRTTTIRTANNETVTVPNTELTTNSIVRPYGREEYRVAEEVGVSYDDDLSVAMTELRKAAESHPAILGDPEPRVYLTEFGGDEVVLQIQYWVRNPTRRDTMRVRSELSLAIKSRLDAAGITLSPVSARELSGDLRVEESTPEDGSSGLEDGQ
jgi:small conductance mechanosensitive channel